GLWSSAYGFLVWPPRALQPLIECVERKFAHSLRLVFPRITAPAARKRAATAESFGARQFSSAIEPAVVFIRSPVSMLSLTKIGTPASGPGGRPALRSRSDRAAIARASGLISITALSLGPLRSIASMRARYSSTSRAEVHLPARRPAASSE